MSKTIIKHKQGLPYENRAKHSLESIRESKTNKDNKQTNQNPLSNYPSQGFFWFCFCCWFVLVWIFFSYLMLGTVQTSSISWWGCSKDSEKSACFYQTHILVLKKFAQVEIAFSDFERGLKLSSSFLLFQITTILGQHVNFRISI